jgi:hypothetical protein
MKTAFSFLFSLIFLILPVTDIFSQERTADFRKVVERRFSEYKINRMVNRKLQSQIGIKLEQVCPIDTSYAAKRVFAEYGAVFVARNGVSFPARCIFETETDVIEFQKLARPVTKTIGKFSITLQEPAMTALTRAIDSAAKKGLVITPRGNRASVRSFAETLKLWDSRFYPGLNYWVRRGKILRQETEFIKRRPLNERVGKVLEWEDKGFFFSKDFSKTILQSVAVPGASQHIFMLALDVEQFSDLRVRQILAENGWFQTVKSDLPHFTYLGVKESDLPALGLKPVLISSQKFWIPNI